MTVVDCHAHALPPSVQNAFVDWLKTSGATSEGPPGLWSSPAFSDVDLHLADADRHDIETTILTYGSNTVAAMHAAAQRESPKPAAETMIARTNDALRSWAAHTSNRLMPTRWVDPRFPDSAVSEIERAATDGGVAAISMNSAYGDPASGLRFLDDPGFGPTLRAAEAADVVVIVHPSAKFSLNSQPPLTGTANHLLTGGLSMLVETTTCISRLILSGVFDKNPKLRMVFSQLGGVLPMAFGRFDMLRDLVSVADETATKAVSALPSLRDYADFIFADTHSMDVAALKCGIEALGSNHLIFGSDFPVTPSHIGREQALKTLDALPLDPVEQIAVRSSNARKLFGLNPTPPRQEMAS
nr:amidohydrolase family protein [Dietzia timorensis]